MGRFCRRFLVVAWGVAVLACTATDGPPLRLGTNVWPGYEPLYLGRDLGYLDRQMVTLVEYLSASEVLRAFRNESLEAAALTLDEVLLLEQQHFPVQVVLVLDISHGADALLSQPHVQTIPELVGKRVGIEVGAVGAYIISRVLEQHGLSLQDITVVPLEVHEHLATYTSGQVDAVVTFEPVRTQLLTLGARELFSSRNMPDEVVDVLAVHKAYLAAHPERFRRVVQGWFRALAYLAANPTDAAERMHKRLHVSAEVVLGSYEGIRLPDYTENTRLLGGNTPGLSETARRLQEVMLARNLLHTPVDLEHLMTPLVLSEGRP